MPVSTLHTAVRRWTSVKIVRHIAELYQAYPVRKSNIIQLMMSKGKDFYKLSSSGFLDLHEMLFLLKIDSLLLHLSLKIRVR